MGSGEGQGLRSGSAETAVAESWALAGRTGRQTAQDDFDILEKAKLDRQVISCQGFRGGKNEKEEQIL